METSHEIIRTFPLGLHSVRYNTYLRYDKRQLLFALEGAIVLWDIDEFKQLRYQPVTNNSITYLAITEKHIAVFTYDGEIILLDKVTWGLIAKAESVHYSNRSCFADLHDKYFGFASEIGDKGGYLCIYCFDNKTLKLVSEIEGRYKMCHITKEGYIIAIKREKVDIDGYMIEVYKMDSYSPLRVKGIPIKDPSKLICMETSSDLLVVTSYNKKVYVLDLATLEIIHKFTVNSECESPPFALHKSIYFVPQEGIICKVDFGNAKEIQSLTHLDGTNKHPSVKLGYILNKDFSPFYTGLLIISEDDNELVFFKNSSIELFKVTPSFFNTEHEIEHKEISGLKLTCCGLDLSYDLKYVAVGSLGREIHVYSLDQLSTLNKSPAFCCKLSSSVRSLAFHPTKACVFAGLMNGTIFAWNFLDNTFIKLERLKGCLDSKGAVTSLKFSSTSPFHLLATFTSGEVDIFQETPGAFTQLHNCLAHEAGNPSTHFGSLGHYAEIWSAAWDCSGIGRLATVSEDQTCRVWELSQKPPLTLTEVFRAKDHKLAVTCVDWKKVKVFDGELLAACSDDRIISLYNPVKEFVKIGELSTLHLKDWHTLTYLAIEENGTRLVCGTQHGYLAVWDLITMKSLFMKKVQNGGIEGLKWRGNVVATCSSDCDILIINIT